MGKVTHDQANLMLRLYEMRREPALREARDWYFEQVSSDFARGDAPASARWAARKTPRCAW